MHASEYTAMFHAEAEHCWYKSLRDEVIYWIEQYLQEQPAAHNKNIRLLDIGCGTGGMLARLQDSFKQIKGVGMDYYEMPLHFAQQKTHWPLVRADVKKMPFRPGTFDVILCLDVLYTREAFPAFDAVLNDMRRLLASRGILILQAPAFKALYSQHDVNVHGAYRFTAGEIRDRLQRSGFNLIGVYYRYNLLLGVAWMMRKLLRCQTAESHVSMPPAPINSLLYRYFKLESRVNKRLRIPFGLSVFAAASRCIAATLLENCMVLVF
jgi:SAM-dependent methyltransferase